jgi:hypothetical protein
MLSKGIDTTIRELVSQLPKGQAGTSLNADEFEKIITPLANEIAKTLIAQGQTTATPTATPDPTKAPSTRLSPFQLSLLKDQESPVLELLPGNLTAGDMQYNQRETLLRNRLDLDGLERRLRDSAQRMDVSYDRSDLDGIIRNSGYDAVHLGSTERYMAAVERNLAKAEERYKERAGNIPNQSA